MLIFLVEAHFTAGTAPYITTRKVDINDKKDHLKQFYSLLNCDYIDITQVDINGKMYDCIVDDEGLLKPNAVPSFYISDDRILCGNILFAHVDEEGETIGLEEDEIPALVEAVKESIPKINAFLSKLVKERRNEG